MAQPQPPNPTQGSAPPTDASHPAQVPLTPQHPPSNQPLSPVPPQQGGHAFQQQEPYGQQQPYQQQQPAWGQPQYPPQGYQYPPQQLPQGAPPQFQGYPQQYPQYPPQPGQYPPPQQAYPYGVPPPAQQPLAGYGYQMPPAPPPQSPYGAQQPPMAQPYSAPAAYGTGPSLGYVPDQMSPADASNDVDALRKAMKGLGTDETTLIRILAHADPLYAAKLNHTFTQRLGRSLEKDIKSEASGNLEKILLTFVRGPLLQDVHAVRSAVKGLGTNEDLLNDVLAGRSNADLQAIKRAYRDTFNRSLEDDVGDDLSGRTKQIFTMIVAGNKPEEMTPVDPQAVNNDVQELHNALLRPADNDIIVIARILTGRSNAQLRAIDQTYNQLHKPSLRKHIVEGVQGHAGDVFADILRKATDPVNYEVDKIWHSIYGKGPKATDAMLIERISRLHWNKPHMHAVKEAYKTKWKKDLVKALADTKKGDYMKAMIAAMDA